MSWMIKLEDVSKMYRLGLISSATLQDDLKRIWYNLRGKEDPFLKIGEENKRDTDGGNYVWALKDINFEVNQGDILGIIGKNGAGKSTLLKLLSKVTKPTTGTIKTRGRIASLLEVGTGFHPELTGRENIFLNGAILGMKKREIKSKFDEIVDFSGCERYIDTPVKRYSSGMYVRLAFAVAAHLEPEILVVDEVLAVGDAEFQKKAIGKMKNVSQGQGRTVLFVSHNMTSIMELCDKSLLLNNGKIQNLGETHEIINEYLSLNRAEKNTPINEIKNRSGNGYITFDSMEMLNENNKNISSIICGQKIKFKLGLIVNKNLDYKKIHISIKFVDNKDSSIFHLSNSVSNGKEFKIMKETSSFSVICEIDRFPLNIGNYNYHLFCSDLENIFDEINFAGEIKVESGNFFNSGNLPSSKLSPYLIDNKWYILN